MVSFKPENRQEELKGFEGSVIYNAYNDDGEIIGRAYIKTDMLYCDVYRLEYPKDKLYVGQGLLRAAYNYGVGVNAYMGRLSAPDCEEVAKSMNFIFDGTSYVNDIPTLLMGSCCCCDEI